MRKVKNAENEKSKKCGNAEMRKVTQRTTEAGVPALHREPQRFLPCPLWFSVSSLWSSV